MGEDEANSSQPPPVARRLSGTDAAQNIPVYLICALYFLIQILLFSRVDPWRDEAQAWLWALELRTLSDFLFVPGEGHPPLWFWLLKLLSTFLNFDQARLFSLGIALLNATLLARLVGRSPLLLVALLFSNTFLFSWGLQFRPYGLIFGLCLLALLLNRKGHRVAATWVMALSCGFHFFSGFLFGFWLLVMWRRGMFFRQMAGPALVAALFGLSAVLSGAGNPASGLNVLRVFPGVLETFASPFMFGKSAWPVIIPIVALLLFVGLRKDRFVLGALAAMIVLFIIFATLVYGQYLWHVAFMLVMILLAFLLAKPDAPSWPLALLMAPQLFFGVIIAVERIAHPLFSDQASYAALIADAGSRLKPESNLVSWPDFMLSALSARHDFSYISGNDGSVIGPVNWRNRTNDQLDQNTFGGLEAPYWLVCVNCEKPLSMIEAAGRSAVEILSEKANDREALAVYRIEDDQD